MLSSKRTRGFLILDALAAIGLTAILAVAITTAFHQYADARRHADIRQELRLTAECELNRLRAVGIGDSASITQPIEGSRGEILLETRTDAGEGAWIGMTHVTVTASRSIFGRRIKVSLSAYVSSLEAAP